MMIRTILLVLEKGTIHDRLEQQLRGRFGILRAASWDDFCNHLYQKNFDLIIARSAPPRQAKLEWTRAFSGEDPFPPVICLTTTPGQTTGPVTEDYLDEPCDLHYLTQPDSEGHLETIIQHVEDQLFGKAVLRHLNTPRSGDTEILLGKSNLASQMREAVRKLARTEAAVLIQGEPGVGKERIARYLHRFSPRAGAPFIAVDCAAMSSADLESALFGDKPEAGSSPVYGSDAGAAFRLAQGGSLLLQEISALPESVQKRVLEVLARRKQSDLNTSITGRWSVRLLITSHGDLPTVLGESSGLGPDLFQALNIVPLRVPPLRDRAADLPALAEHFRERQARKHGLEVWALSPDSLTALQAHTWPGNIDELESVIDQAVLSCSRGVVEPDHLRGPFARSLELADGTVNPSACAEKLQEVEKAHILEILARCQGNRTHAAKRLGISIRTLRNKLREYRHQDGAGIDPAEERPPKGSLAA